MFKSKEDRAERHESRVQALEERAENDTEKALRNLRARRAWIIQTMAIWSGKPSAFNDDLTKAAQELHYLDSAIASLSASQDS